MPRPLLQGGTKPDVLCVHWERGRACHTLDVALHTPKVYLMQNFFQEMAAFFHPPFSETFLGEQIVPIRTHTISDHLTLEENMFLRPHNLLHVTNTVDQPYNYIEIRGNGHALHFCPPPSGPPVPLVTVCRLLSGGALAAVRAQCKLEVYLGTLPVITATIKRPPQKLPRSLRDLLATIKKTPRETGLVLAAQLLQGPMGCLGGCILGWCPAVFDL